MKALHIKSTLLFALPCCLTVALMVGIATSDARAQLAVQPRLARTKGSAEGAQTAAATSTASIEVSKTASVSGQNVCGTIRIRNNGGQTVTVTGIADSLEVHFPKKTSTSLPAGSTIEWYKVANVPISLPGPIASGATAVIDYCFSL